jgi:hypothetical protein
MRISFTINRLVKKKTRTQVQHSFLHLQPTRHQLSLDGFSNCVAVLALDFDTPVSWARRFSYFLGVCSCLAPMSSSFSSGSTRRLCFCFLCIKNPIVLSLFTKLWIVCLLGTLSSQNLLEIFARDSHSCHIEIHIALKHTAPWRTTLLNNCSWEQMANGADNCWLLLTDHKQTPMHEPHCSLFNIIPSSGPHVNYFPSFQTLWADTSANSHAPRGRLCTGPREAQSRERVNRFKKDPVYCTPVSLG